MNETINAVCCQCGDSHRTEERILRRVGWQGFSPLDSDHIGTCPACVKRLADDSRDYKREASMRLAADMAGSANYSSSDWPEIARHAWDGAEALDMERLRREGTQA